MPYVKSISIHATVNRSIAYILNRDKTEDMLYTASLNCMTDAKEAYLAMKMVYENFSKKSYDAPLPAEGKGAVKAIHYVQSFDPDDNIPPELAFKIAKTFALKSFGENCQVVIATHTNKKHIHSHIIVNSYGLDGKKFIDNQNTLKKIRKSSDEVCLAYGIKPIESKGKTIAYNEWENKKRGTSWKQKIRDGIDSLVGKVNSVDELLSELERSGYEVKRGKYISVRAEGQERFIRTKTLGGEYSEDSLKIRIRYKDKGAAVTPAGDEISEMHRDYYKTIYKVSELARLGQKVVRRHNRAAPYTPANDLDVYRLSAQLAVLNRDNIQSIGELEGKISDLKNSYEKTRSELNLLISRQERIASLVEQAEIYFALKDKPRLSQSEKLKLSIGRQAAESARLSTFEDLSAVKNLKSDNDKKNAVLKENFKDCEQLYSVYADIAKTYHSISGSDYISQLVEEERVRREGEEKAKRKSRGR